MSSRGWATKLITIISLATFALTAGCATTPLPSRLDGHAVTMPSARIDLSQADGKTTPEAPLRKEVLRKGQIAPDDGVWFDKESAKIVLGDLAELRQLKIKIQIQDQLIAAYEEQGTLLRESNDLMAQSNEQFRKEIESKRKWGTVKNVVSVIAAVAAFALGIWAAK